MEGEIIQSDVGKISQKKQDYIPILKQCLAGEELAKKELHKRFNRKVFEVCFSYMKRECQTEEVVNDVFLKVFLNLPSLENLHAFYAWLMRIAHTTAINAYNKKRVHEPEILVEKFFDTVNTDVFDVIFMNQEHESLSQLIVNILNKDDFPEGYKKVLKLYYMEGLDHQEISEYLGISKSTSKTQLKKAKAKIQRILQEEEYHQCG